MKVAITQVTDQKHWSGLTRDMHLAYAGLKKPPAMINDLIENIYEMNYGDDNLVSHIEKYGTHYVDQETYQWMLKGSSERTIPLVKATLIDGTTTITTATTTQIGLNFTPFYLFFAEQYFTCPSVIAGLRPEDYQMRIMEDPVEIGGQWRYKVQLFGNNQAGYVPVEELIGGVMYSELYAVVEREFSKRGSDLHFASFFTLQNTLSTIRKKYAVPGNMIHKGGNIPLAFKFQDDDGKTMFKWIDYVAWEFYKQMRRDKARLILYGKSTLNAAGVSNIFGESGNAVITGYGLYDQMQGSNVGFYNNFSIDAFSRFLMELSVGKIAEDSREFLVTTGEFGALQFHMAASQKASTYTWLRSPHNFQKSANGGMKLAEGQIMEYEYVNGIKIKLMVDPMLDTPITVGKIKHPNGGWLSSYIYNVWDFGTQGGKPNIQKVAIKGDEEYMIYVPGLRDPFTPGGMGANMTPAAHAIDTYEVHKMINTSVMLRNPLRSGRYMPNAWKGLV